MDRFQREPYSGLGQDSVYTDNVYTVSVEGAPSLDEALSKFFSYTFGWMFLGLLLTGITSFLVTKSVIIYMLAKNPLLFYILLGLELLLVIGITGTATHTRMPLAVSAGLFVIYSILNGVTLSPIFLIYTHTSIATVFLITSVLFGTMALIGFITRKVINFGGILFAGLIALLIGEIINIFLHSPGLYHILTISGIGIFMGLTAYDVGKLRYIAEKHIEVMGPSVIGTRALMGAAIQGALALYLDFINLFLYLLRLLGRRK